MELDRRRHRKADSQWLDHCNPIQYAASDGSSGWFSSSYKVNSGHAADGNAHFGYFCLSEDVTDAVSPFQCSGAKSYLSLQSQGSVAIANMTGKLNTSTAGSWSSQWGSTVGHFVLQQNTTTQLEVYLDGTSYGTSTQTHSAHSGTVQILGNGSTYTNRQVAFVHYGAKLTAQQHLDLSKALYTFLTTMDVRPKSGYLGLTTGPTNVAPYKPWCTKSQPSTLAPFTHIEHPFQRRLYRESGGLSICRDQGQRSKLSQYLQTRNACGRQGVI
jgi:hypothetical protein